MQKAVRLKLLSSEEPVEENEALLSQAVVSQIEKVMLPSSFFKIELILCKNRVKI